MRDHVDGEAVVDLTRRLVAVDTQNPPGNEAAAAEVARDALSAFGATFQTVEPAPGRVSLVATVGAGDGRRPTLLVNGHLDVVPVDPTAWAHDPFGGDVEGGRVYGRGTADMKGGIACAVEALATLRRAGREPAGDVVFHLVADEEVGGGLGTAVLLDAGLLRGDACLDPEPTALGICVAERGVLWATLTVDGVPAHGSRPQDGLSAVEKAARIVLALHGADFGDPHHPLLGSPTCNVGRIAGGTAANVVAERCRLGIDRRVLPGVTEADAVASLRRRIDALQDPEIRYEIEVDTFCEASALDADHELVTRLQRAFTTVTGRAAPVIGLSGSTDARFVRNQAGIPAVVCGPGQLEQAHTVDEWVAIDRLVDATAVYAELFATFA
jgi:acetylornithine deacetylase/succinyl-diaminopimelate desuccinylase family protein